MTREELIDRLLQQAHIEASSHNCKFSADADSQLRELVTAGVGRMTVDELRNNAKIIEAEHNIRFLCKKLCERTRNENRMIVENRTFSSARMSICPLWPFC